MGALPQIRFPKWLKWWLLISSFIVSWDAGYSLLRPWTMQGGSLYFFWQPYDLYRKVDLIYGNERWLKGDRFCEAQSVCNVIEVGLQVFALYLLSKKHVPAAAVVALISQGFTFWKTVLYWLYDILGGLESTGHNPLLTWIFIYGIPNGAWIVVPFFSVVALTSELLRVLNAVQPATTDSKTAKVQ